jgi:predicted secreted protein
MNWFTGTATYLVLWFLVLFTVLPWGIKVAESPEEGHATSAPVNPRLGLKILITTFIAAVLWFGVDYIVDNDIVDFRQPETSLNP